MNRKRGFLIAVILIGLVVMVAGCEINQYYSVNVNDDKSGTITVTLKMNTSNYEALSTYYIIPCAEPSSNNLLNWVGARYFQGYTKQMLSNVSEGGDTFVRLRYTVTASNLDGVSQISTYITGGKLRFQDQRFITLCNELTNDPCMGPVMNCSSVTIEYTLTMPRAITNTNGSPVGSNQAEWTFNADAGQLITAECNAPPTPTPATTTTATTTTTTTTETPCPDTDGDGWDDCFEATMGTNPYQQDSDNDGIIDSIDPNPLVASTTTATTTTASTAAATTTTTTERTPAPALVLVIAVIAAVTILLNRKR